MTLSKFSIWRAQRIHRLLKTISRTYREASALQDRLNIETSAHLTTKAKLALSEQELASARSSIQSLTFGSQRASEDAARLRDERDIAREQALEARADAAQVYQKTMDWMAKGQPRGGIFEPSPAVPEDREAPVGAGSWKGRAQAGSETIRDWNADLSAIKQRQQSRRAEAMQPIHLDAESLPGPG